MDAINNDNKEFFAFSLMTTVPCFFCNRKEVNGKTTDKMAVAYDG